MNTATLTNLRELNAVALKTSLSSAVRGLTVPAATEQGDFQKLPSQSCFSCLSTLKACGMFFEAPHFLA